VVARTVRTVAAPEAWRVVAGVTVGQDYSERTLQLAGPTKQFSLGKSFPNFGPTGPVLVTPEELADKDDLHLRCSVNGRVVQDARTSQMIFPVSDLISRLSMVCTLLPGDLIFTGTPGGLGMTMQPPRYLTRIRLRHEALLSRMEVRDRPSPRRRSGGVKLEAA